MHVQSDIWRNRVPVLGPRMLAACIAAALASDVVHADGSSRSAMHAPAEIRFVTNCDDDGPGSLRAVLAESASSDWIDFTNLSCSLITLTTGELSTDLEDIRLNGNYATISAGGASRVLAHNGNGNLFISNLRLADGHVAGNSVAGGCLYSRGDISLWRVYVHDCSVASTPGFTSRARGGGVYGAGSVWLYQSSIRDSVIVPAGGTYSYGKGAGVYAYGELVLDESTISGNTVSGSGGYKEGGGIFSRSSVSISYSTISGNSAFFAGAGFFGAGDISEIRNSTISGNTAQFRTGGIATNDVLLRVRNSTIAFNSALQGVDGVVGGGGVITLGFKQYLSVRSSIIAMNTAGGVEDDVCINDFNSGLAGLDNIILAANVPLPEDTIELDPMLAPLALNGGPTMTHALLSGSPAIDAGNNSFYFLYDQRIYGHPRVSGHRADIGAFEVQQPELPDPIFTNGFD